MLAEHGRQAPAFDRLTVETLHHQDWVIRFTVHFHGGLSRAWQIDAHRLTHGGRDEVLHPGFEIQLRSLYSRLYEDHLIELDLRVAREAYIGVISTTGVPVARRQAARAFDQHQDMIRRTHRGGFYGRSYRSLLPEPPDRRPAVDYQMVDYTTCTATLEQIEQPALTATMVNELAERAQRLQREAMAELVGASGVHVGISINYAALQAELNRLYFGHTGFTGFFGDTGSSEAQDKGLTLLKSWLSPQQLADYERLNHFEVIGGQSGKRYRIRHGRQMNIDELDPAGNKVCGWCFLPEGQLVAGDIMLAQKIALECDEERALSVANRFDQGNGYYEVVRPMRVMRDDAGIVVGLEPLSA